MMYLAGDRDNNIFADGSYDAGVIVHEYTHGVSGRLGRDVYDTYQGRAMGEAWSDFYALEMTLPEGARPEDSYVLGEYLFQSFGIGVRSRPYSTDMTSMASRSPITAALRISVWKSTSMAKSGSRRCGKLAPISLSCTAKKKAAAGCRSTSSKDLKLQPPRASMIDARDAIFSRIE